MNSKFFLVLCLLICSFGAAAQSVFTFSDTIFNIGQTQTFQNIRFKINKPDLIHDSVCQPYLDSIVEFCLAHPEMQIEVGLHTDSRGLLYRSAMLGESRARSLRQYLIDQGVKELKIVPVSYGAERPIHQSLYIEQFKEKNKEKYDQLHQENRRVVLTILSVD